MYMTPFGCFPPYLLNIRFMYLKKSFSLPLIRKYLG
jgi:hypothetical protein